VLYDRFVTHKVHANALPPHDFADIVRTEVMGAAPPGTNQVFFSGPSSADANEAAIATAMSHYAARNNLDSVAGVCVVGFNNSNHG